MPRCECASQHVPRRIVLTGGPGAGKTAVLELVRQAFCQHVRVLPEAASLVFGGGFPRGELLESRRAAQRAIFHVQRELEREAEAHGPAIVLCDRGTVDGLAYWPGDADQLWSEVASDEARELTRYAAVIHLATPALEYGYNHQNPLRVESPTTAAEIDARIRHAWRHHPKRHVVESSVEFLDKVARALTLLRAELPACCAGHHVPSVPGEETRLPASPTCADCD